MGLLRAGDPHREVWFAWNAKEVVRQIYDHTDHQLAADWVDEIVRTSSAHSSTTTGTAPGFVSRSANQHRTDRPDRRTNPRRV